jgi:undecaprenyl-diphosphatase
MDFFMEYFDTFTAVLLAWGIYGLIIASFTECFISPVPPDFILIPLALANPEMAIIYAVATVLASVPGGFVGYAIGVKLGEPAVKRMIPAKYADSFHAQVRRNASLAIFLAALSPMPYKIVCITAGALRVRIVPFVFSTLIGRSKRFMVEGVLIYYFGDKALALMNDYLNHFMIGFLVLAVVIAVGIIIVRKYKKSGDTALD